MSVQVLADTLRGLARSITVMAAAIEAEDEALVEVTGEQMALRFATLPKYVRDDLAGFLLDGAAALIVAERQQRDKLPGPLQ